jgi:hypothetical protein
MHLFLGSNEKLVFVLRVFTLRAVLEERIKFVNQAITVIGNGCKNKNEFQQEIKSMELVKYRL